MKTFILISAIIIPSLINSIFSSDFEAEFYTPELKRCLSNTFRATAYKSFTKSPMIHTTCSSACTIDSTCKSTELTETDYCNLYHTMPAADGTNNGLTNSKCRIMIKDGESYSFFFKNLMLNNYCFFTSERGGCVGRTLRNVVKNAGDVALEPALFHRVKFNNRDTAYIDLAGNSIRTLPKRAFSPLTDLLVCLLHNNKISVLDSSIFEGLTKLYQVTLYGNQLVTLPPYLFKSTSVMLVLSLSSTITSIDESTFLGLQTKSLTISAYGVPLNEALIESYCLCDITIN
jgi:hypothetical protein